MSQKYWILDSPVIRTAKWDAGNTWVKSGPDPAARSNEEILVGFGGPASRLSNLRVVLKTGDVRDFAWTVADCLARDRVAEMLREQGFTGFETRPVRARFEAASLARVQVPELSELLVTGWGGIASDQSGVSRIPRTNKWEGSPDWTRIVDPDAWDGSDFFIVWPFPFTRLVTNRVARFIRDQGLSGVKLISPKAYTAVFRSISFGRTAPLRLRDHFPDARAREIGAPLGIY